MIEFPKALYKAGELLVVDDEAGEAQARKDGYDGWMADHERHAGAEEGDEAAAPPARKPKAKAAEAQ